MQALPDSGTPFQRETVAADHALLQSRDFQKPPVIVKQLHRRLATFNLGPLSWSRVETRRPGPALCRFQFSTVKVTASLKFQQKFGRGKTQRGQNSWG